MDERSTADHPAKDNEELWLNIDRKQELKKQIAKWQADESDALENVQKKLIREVDFNLLDDSTKTIIETFLQLKFEDIAASKSDLIKLNDWHKLERKIIDQYKEIDKIKSLGFSQEYDREQEEFKRQRTNYSWAEIEIKLDDLEKKHYRDLYAKRCALDFIHYMVTQEIDAVKRNLPQAGKFDYDKTKFNV